jgi:plastocyanin
MPFLPPKTSDSTAHQLSPPQPQPNMINSAARSFLLQSAIAILVLASPFAAFGQAESKMTATPAASEANSRKTHTITITYANGAWSYAIQPAQANPKKAKVKRGDTLLWVSADGNWTVFFKDGATPLVNGNGDPVSTVSGASGAAAGDKVGAKAKDNDTFTYGVKLLPNNGGPEVVDDPEIIIES